jgi:hypothetical protein
MRTLLMLLTAAETVRRPGTWENNSSVQGESLINCSNLHGKNKGKAIPVNRPWRPVGLCDVEAPTFSRQSTHRGQ